MREADFAVGHVVGVLAVHHEVGAPVGGQEFRGAVHGEDPGEERRDGVHEGIHVVEQLLGRHLGVVRSVLEEVKLALAVGLAVHEDRFDAVHRILRGEAGVPVCDGAVVVVLELALCDHR